MAIQPLSRAEFLRRLTEYMRHDVKNVLRMEHGGNYTAALVVCVGSDALSQILDDPHTPLVRALTRRGLDEHVARDVEDALRNGTAHVFETQYIQVGQHYVELVVSWGAGEHLSRREEADHPRLVLNVRTMWEDLQAALAEAQASLDADPAFAGQPPRQWRKMLICGTGPKSVAAWRAMFPASLGGTARNPLDR